MKSPHSSMMFLSGVIALAVSGCTQPKETTAIGAAAGGALGAGLGAIIGSQTGDAGGGLVIGAVAGSAAGGLVGNALQAQEESVRSQNEAIGRQERMIGAQHAEIEELRRMNSDAVMEKQAALRERGPAPTAQRPVATGRRFDASVPSAAATTNENRDRARLAPSGSSSSRGGMIERDLTAPIPREAPLAQATLDTHEVPAAKLAVEPRSEPAGEGCSEAQTEFSSAKAAKENPDKLFHLRRALRLCPDNASYHHELGKVYLSLDRKSDAEYEFQQALSIDPSHRGAKSSLEAAKKGGGRF